MSSSRRIALILMICNVLSTTCSGFIEPKATTIIRNEIAYDHSKPTASLRATRRNFLQSIALIISAPLQPALAKEAPEIVTQQTVTEAFDAVRHGLTDSKGVVSTLSNLIDDGSFEDIILYTRESDAYFRRAKMGRARKLLTDKDLKGEALLMNNAVTFDLIGINRASRPGKENRDEQLRYLGELKNDIKKFLELEKTIVLE